MKRFAWINALAALGTVFFSCVPDGPLKTNFDRTPMVTTDGWAVSTPSAEGINPKSINAAYAMIWQENAFFGVKSMLVIRHGKLVAENYCRSADDRYTRANVQSTTKCITAIALGMVHADGHLTNLDTPIVNILSSPSGADSRIKNITLRHLLTMRSGLSMDNASFTVKLCMDREPDPMGTLLSLPFYANPGDSFVYRDVDPHILSHILQKTTGRTEAAFVKTRLFDPLGITNWSWDTDATGASLGAGGLFLTARDMGKIGEMILDSGIWAGHRIVPADWIDSMVIPRVKNVPDHSELSYGFYWWSSPKDSVFSTWGHGGQFILVDRARNLVLVMTAMPDAGDGPGISLEQFLPVYRTLINGISP